MQNQNNHKGKQQIEEKIIEMDQGGDRKDDQQAETLPPGFRFHPSDEELITYYLVNKISDANFTGRAIGDVDLNKCEPWDLPGKAKMGEKEWYFFSLRDRKYPTGVRTNRATNTGYWKTTGKDKEIFNSVTSELVGMKKTLVFYRGRAPRGEKTNWVMHEYRIHSKAAFRTAKDEWVVCRVFQKSAAGVKKFPSNHSRAVLNPYSLEIGPSMVPSQMLQAAPEAYHQHHHHHHQFPINGRNYMPTAADHHQLAELTRMFRGGGHPGASSTAVNLPIQPQMNNYQLGGGFTISGLNLNLGGGGAATPPVLRSIPPPTQPMNQVQDVNNVTSNCFAGPETGFGAEVSNPNGGGNRYMSMENCMDLDNYWPSY
ncbi:hypothetical protein Ddye_007570 [Dipteronia dyeriana]|uniref:NAC domain-containing protein n=1 Tax=Dipteronia dyeriana TaxID=168575 RepID=A0AAD9XKU4_9ROSI|nr:hypothetical protein Ddye_007570 [Dipteronia dyeriana]